MSTAATAASTALPPARSTSAPARAVTGCPAATTPDTPTTLRHPRNADSRASGRRRPRPGRADPVACPGAGARGTLEAPNLSRDGTPDGTVAGTATAVHGRGGHGHAARVPDPADQPGRHPGGRRARAAGAGAAAGRRDQDRGRGRRPAEPARRRGDLRRPAHG